MAVRRLKIDPIRHCAFLMLLIVISLHPHAQTLDKPTVSWCDHPLRASLTKLTELKTLSHWFRVYQLEKNIYAVVEPYNEEEVISYLILGHSRALLFDTGMGLDSISPVVKQLTTLPVTVINSHTHYDHMGGNYEFDHVLAMRTGFTLLHAREGWDHPSVKHEVTTDALCLQQLPGFDTAHYKIRPFPIAQFVKDGDEIDLGGVTLRIVAVPGHTPDAIALLDKAEGYLWTGDSFYQGPIYLFSDETDLAAYEKSVERLAALVPEVKEIFPAHNDPVCAPERLLELKYDFAEIKNGQATGAETGGNTELFSFAGFGFLISKEKLTRFRYK
jgi:glyoxylase-like metal-dependent hydrolase (beta-lactamase superfamily II)